MRKIKGKWIRYWWQYMDWRKMRKSGDVKKPFKGHKRKRMVLE